MNGITVARKILEAIKDVISQVIKHLKYGEPIPKTK